jgi:signal transduction histidine kinase
VLCRLFEERRELRFANQELKNEINEKNKIEKELTAAAAELSRKNSELTAALHNLEQAQKQVILQDKMASIGHLAAGITHEISNPLIFVTSNVETLGRYFAVLGEVLAGSGTCTPSSPPSANTPQRRNRADGQKRRDKAVDHILADLPVLFEDTLQGLQRLNAIVKGVRHFAHVDRQNAFRRYNLNEGLENALLVAHNQIKQHAEIELDLGPLPPFEAVRSDIDQVLLNLIINAVQAIGAKHTAGRGLIKISTWCAAAAVYCAIEDNGVGIPSHSLGNIFDPFYTTKPVGQGTGLGLSISYDIIVNRHQGEITVDSVEGQGAKFTIKLPIKHEWA